ncbi:DUF6538 domain-containing protein [Mesorhizobium sp. URHB0026]
MTGPWPHPKTGILYFRKATPPDLFAKRARLEALGAKVTREIHRSLGTRDRKEAERKYREVGHEVDTEWGRLRELLRDGPLRLNHQQVVALAAERAAAFLAMHEPDPFDAPPVAGQVPPLADDGRLARVAATLPASEQLALVADLKRYLSATEDEQTALTLSLLEAYPALRTVVAPDLAAALEAMHGEQSDGALSARSLRVDAESRRLLNLQMSQKMAAVGLALADRRAGNYGPVPELDNAPAFIAKPPTPRSSGKGVTFEAIIDAQATKRKAGQGSKPMPDKSVKKYKRIAEAFAAHRGSRNATTVTVLEVEAWQDAMQGEAEVSNRTIADRLVAMGTIINWGKKQRDHREAMAQAESISGRIELPGYMEKPADETSYTMAEARTVLLAARREEDTSKRWLPWVCLYAGLRISEANTLRKADFFQAEGLWFFKVTSAGKRSLKTANSERRIPVHPALEAEGFTAWVQAAPEGQLFRDGATSLLGRWARSKAVGLARPGLSPNHGLRHLFVGLCRRYGLEGGAAEYLAGHSTQDVHAKYGSSEVMLPGLAAELMKVKALLGPSGLKGSEGVA